MASFCGKTSATACAVTENCIPFDYGAIPVSPTTSGVGDTGRAKASPSTNFGPGAGFCPEPMGQKCTKIDRNLVEKARRGFGAARSPKTSTLAYARAGDARYAGVGRAFDPCGNFPLSPKKKLNFFFFFFFFFVDRCRGRRF